LDQLVLTQAEDVEGVQADRQVGGRACHAGTQEVEVCPPVRAESDEFAVQHQVAEIG
jgi:hypothetical protein